MTMRALFIASALGLLAACGQPQMPPAESSATMTPDGEFEAALEEHAPLPAVDGALLQIPSTAFVAIEPTEIGVIGSPNIREALAPLISAEALGEGEAVQLSVRETDDSAVADVVRTGLADDSVAAGHVRIEFRREEEGWFPTNAYRRQQCRRGAQAGQWTTELCA